MTALQGVRVIFDGGDTAKVGRYVAIRDHVVSARCEHGALLLLIAAALPADAVVLGSLVARNALRKSGESIEHMTVQAPVAYNPEGAK